MGSGVTRAEMSVARCVDEPALCYTEEFHTREFYRKLPL